MLLSVYCLLCCVRPDMTIMVCWASEPNSYQPVDRALVLLCLGAPLSLRWSVSTLSLSCQSSVRQDKGITSDNFQFHIVKACKSMILGASGDLRVFHAKAISDLSVQNENQWCIVCLCFHQASWLETGNEKVTMKTSLKLNWEVHLNIVMASGWWITKEYQWDTIIFGD